MTDRTCSIERCEGQYYARGWCNKHWQRWRRHGDPQYVTTYGTEAARFWSKVEKTDSCWLWVAGKTEPGYGVFNANGRSGVGAHRWAYEALVGPIPEGLVIDHLCSNPSCVNPAHLEPVTQGENTRRGRNATKTHCIRGHEYTPANTLRSKSGARVCRTCNRLRLAQRRARTTR